MKILVWADLHGHNFREFSTIEDGMNSRLNDCVEVVKEVFQSAKKHEVDGVWFVGDLFHLKNNLDSRVMKAIMYEMKNLAESFPVIIVPGNHDYRAWTSEPILLEILGDFSVNFCLCEKGGQMGVLPYDGEVYIEPYTRGIKELNERIAKLETDPKKDIFFGHQDMIGFYYGGFQVVDGLDPDILSKKFRWSFVGHNHNPGEYNGNVISVGAPLQHNFGDIGEQRGCWILDTEREELKYINNDFSPQFVDYKYDPNIEEKDFIPGNWERDFFRIKVVGHVELPPRLERIKWKRVSYDVKGEVKKRTTISFSDKKEDIIEKYVKLRGGNLDHKKLVEIGRKYL